MIDVFVDRDGVINVNRPDHVKSWEEFEFLPGALTALARMKLKGIRAFVVTNQAMVSRGIVSLEIVNEINRRMTEYVRRHNGSIEAVLMCTHLPESRCLCRKPSPGLLLRARDTSGVDLSRAYAIGDFVSDLQAARAVGSKPILVLTGRGHEALAMLSEEERKGCLVARDLGEAVSLIERCTEQVNQKRLLKAGNRPVQETWQSP